MGLMLVSLNQHGLCRVRPCLRKKKCITPKVGIFMVSTKIMCAYSAGVWVRSSTVFHLSRVSAALLPTLSGLAHSHPCSSCLAVGVLELDMVAPTTFYMGSKN